MALVVKDRVKETSATSGTGTLTLAGAADGFQAFSAIGDGNTTYYAIVDSATGDWEVGLGTYTASGTTLSRDTVLESSNSGSLVNLAGNTVNVFATYPAEKSVFSDDLPTAVSELTNDSGYITGNQTITLSGDVSGSGTTSISVTVADDSHNHVISNVDGLQTALDAKVDLAGDTMTGNLSFGDDDKAIFGAGSDFQIWHDGSSTNYIDASLGNTTRIQSDYIYLSSSDGSADRVLINTSGIDVTGNITVSGTVDGRDVATDGTKLDGIESGATADQTASEILTAIKTVDGSGSGLDADTVDGVQASSFLRSDATDTFTSTITGSTLLLGGSQITASSASLQVNGFQRTGNIYLHEGGNTPTTAALALSNASGVLKWNNNSVWHAGNDGTGSGLDADTLDGQHGSYYYSSANPPTGTLSRGLTYSTSDPAINTNPSQTGHLWINYTSGEAWLCTDNTSGDNVWNNVGNGTGTVQAVTDFLVVAGGGGGGQGYYAGGGGAGGLRTSYGSTSGGGTSAEDPIVLNSGTTYTITVGAGGAENTQGNSSSISGSGLTTITATGGGRAGYYSGTTNATGGSGGSGGGGGHSSTSTSSGMPGGSGTSGQGYAGGTAASPGIAGGGGGAGEAGNGAAQGNPDGGDGLAVAITGSSVYYAGGGGGTYNVNYLYGSTRYGAGGQGGGGNSSYFTGSVSVGGSAGTANTGGGGGGQVWITPDAFSGGSGVVILRMYTSKYTGTYTGSPTITTDGDFTILKFTSSGTYTA